MTAWTANLVAVSVTAPSRDVQIRFFIISISCLSEEELEFGVATSWSQCFMRCSLSRRAAHKAAWMPNDCSLQSLIASLRRSSSFKVVLVEKSVKEIGESTAVKVLMNCTSWLPHLSEEPEIRHDRVLHPQFFFARRFSTYVSPFRSDSEYRIQLEIVLPRPFRLT